MVDCVANPLGVVRTLFAQALSRNASNVSKSDWGIKELFDKFLLGNQDQQQRNSFSEAQILQIPEINVVAIDSIPANTLVRFRGMIQDMFDVEYYVGVYKDANGWHTNKYLDTLSGEDNVQSEIWDRRLLYCVPVPGENQWLKDLCVSKLLPEVISSNLGSKQGVKRQHEALLEPDNNRDSDMLFDADIDEKKRVKVRDDVGDSSIVKKTDLNMPLGDNKLLSCVMKMYDGSESELKLNDVVEFFGVLAFDSPTAPKNINAANNPTPAELDCWSSAFMEEDVSLQLPVSMVPRLHCITFRKLTTYNHLVCTVPTQLQTSSAQVREYLVAKFTNLLGGDRLAAEYLLLHLVSKVHGRVEPTAIGKFSLNFSGCQAGAEGCLSQVGSAVSQAIAMLLPCSYALSLSLPYLNKELLAPRKNYTTNRLVTGALQLACGTHLTLDETALSSGQLNDTGVKNVQSLKNLLESQKVAYDFEYFTMEMATDFPVLVLSCGKSRLFPADAYVPLKFTSNVVDMSAQELEWNVWRQYLSSVRDADHIIESDIQKFVQEDLVAARQRDRSVGPETFHRWLTMARLLSLSYGERSLSKERWEMVKELEKECNKRIRS